MAGMLEYKCPCCDGAIQFDSATQKMKCPYCDTEFDVDTLKGYDEELKDEKPSEMEWATPGGSWAEGETAGLHTYSCKSCGGEIVGDDTMAASACPFCGNPIVLTGQFAGALRPDLICLLAKRGKPKRRSAGVHQFIISPVEEHSKKPDVTRDKIIELAGDLPRVELFARQKAPGWDVWGNEVDSDLSLTPQENVSETR